MKRKRNPQTRERISHSFPAKFGEVIKRESRGQRGGMSHIVCEAVAEYFARREIEPEYFQAWLITNGRES